MDLSPRKCEYCKKSPGKLFSCNLCEKVWYCNESHRSRHSSQHKVDCYPASVQSEDGCGRFWVATRDISKGELIFTESALIIGPNTECTTSSPLLALAYPTCLGCCRGTNTVYTCSKCHWPVCSKKCEKVSQHADFECKVFKKNKIFASTRPQYYLYIQFLRALILKHVKPALFRKMMELEPHIEGRKSHKEEDQITKSFYKFLTEDCNLKYDYDFIDHLVGVNRINSYSADILNSNSRKRACTALFCEMSLLNHSCLPNTRSVISENADLTLSMNLFASTDISEGECITQQYFPVVKGTRTRRNALKEWFFDCSCTRCADPTEFGTYFSCLRCPSCKTGFLCPVNSLDYSSILKCNRKGSKDCDCDFTMSSEDHSTLITRLEEGIHANDQFLEEMLKSNDIHCHHYLAINLQYEIAQKIVKALNNEREVGLVRSGVKYCKTILEVVDVLCPGWSYYRGVIIYFLANCYYALYEMDELNLKGKECTLEELQRLIEEGINIMSVEPKGSVYREMSQELETYQRHLEQITR